MRVLKGNINKKRISLFPLLYIVIASLVALIPWDIWNGKTIYELWSKGEHLQSKFNLSFNYQLLYYPY